MNDKTVLEIIAGSLLFGFILGFWISSRRSNAKLKFLIFVQTGLLAFLELKSDYNQVDYNKLRALVNASDEERETLLKIPKDRKLWDCYQRNRNEIIQMLYKLKD